MAWHKRNVNKGLSHVHLKFKTKFMIFAPLLLPLWANAADNVVHAGAPVLDRPTLISLGVQLPITGDDNFNASVSMRYRQTGTSQWQDALPLFRVHPAETAVWTVSPQFAGSIFNLRPSTSYDIELFLVDPDGPVATSFTLTGVTRAVPSDPANPRIVPVSDPSGLYAAIGAAQPGDIITLADGVYNIGTLYSFRSGSSTNPIVIRGQSEEGTILDRGNCTNCNIIEVYGSFTHIEQMTLRSAQRAIRFQNNGEQGNVVRHVHVTDTDLGLSTQPGCIDFYITDNIMEGRMQWPFTYESDGGGHSFDDGIVVGGFGHVVSHNRISGYADSLQVNDNGSRAIDFYGNDSLWNYDDGIELDTSEGNVRAFRNRWSNVFVGISLQPVLGGPAYVFRNVIYNVRGEQMKFHALAISPPEEPNGILAYNNTFVSAFNDVYLNTPAVSHHFRLLNNLFVGNPQATGSAFVWGGPIDDGLFDFNGYGGDGPFQFNFLGRGYMNFSNFAAVQGAGIETHGTLLGPSIFANGLSTPANYAVLQAPADVTLSSGSGAIDRGLILPNITDGYTGEAPDLGAYEKNCPIPIYGVRPQGVDETNEPFGCVVTPSSNASAGPLLGSLFVGKSSVMSGDSTTGTVTLTWPVGQTGAKILLSSSSASVTVPGSVIIPAGAALVTFPIKTTSVTSLTSATITAAFSNRATSATLSVIPPLTGTGTFVGVDAKTQGNWAGTYGADGYTIVGAPVVNPKSVTPLASGNGSWTWAPSTTDVRALLKPNSTTDRIAATWYGVGPAFTVDLNFTDNALHQVAVYCLDWEGGRQQDVSIVDANNTVLDTRNLSNFGGGQYFVWTVSGHVKIVATSTANARDSVISGVFFQPVAVAVGGSQGSSVAPSVSFTGLDKATQGNWESRFGGAGHVVAGSPGVNPQFVAPTIIGASSTWAASTTDVRAPQTVNSNNRTAAAWYGQTITIDLNFTDSVKHQVAMYCVDWDEGSRRQNVSVVDLQGKVLDTQSMSGFEAGQYLVWNIRGHVQISVSAVTGANAVVTGLFFEPQPVIINPSAQFVTFDTTTQGNWKGKYGTAGYTLVGDSTINPVSVAPTAVNAGSWTWTPSTSDVRALQKASSSDRIAAAWFGTTFTIQLNFSDAVTHQVAIYCLDWEGGRQQSVSVLNPYTGAVLDTRTLSNFSGGQYLVWTVSGNVQINVISSPNSTNGVVNGVFLNPDTVSVPRSNPGSPTTSATSSGTSAKPTADLVSPSAGSGSAQVFTATYSDPLGVNQMAKRLFLISSTSSSMHACLVQVDSTGMYLSDDTNTALLGPLTATTGVSNSQCTINNTGTTIKSSGNTSVLTLSITFNTFAGQKTIYMSVDDVDGASSGLQTLGSYTVIKQGLVFVPINPCRVLDTRNSPGPFGGPLIGAQSSRSFVIPNGPCNIPAGAQAYSVNVTVVPHGPLGYLTAWPTGQAQPIVSTLNSDGRIKATAAIIPAGAGGAISLFATNATDIVLDINGYFIPSGSSIAGLQFYPLTPCRLIDTRQSNGPLAGPFIQGRSVRSFPITSSSCGIPRSAQAYSLNFTAVPRGSLGYLTAWPTGQPQPFVSTLNAPTGTITANAAIVTAGLGGSINLFTTNDTDLVVDVNGYFAIPQSSGALSFYPLTPCRVLDTRQIGGTGPFSGIISVNASLSSCGAPASAQALVLAATAVPSGALGYLALWPQGMVLPTVATLNAIDGSITSNMAVVPSTSASVSAFASNLTQLVLDLFGYFAP